MAKRILILNGPNLNCLGRREPQIYGTLSMEQVLLDIQHQFPEVHFTYLQSNHEGDLIDWLQAPLLNNADVQDDRIDGIVLNAGGYSHTSVAIRDAVVLCPAPVVEVHISDIMQREPFRRVSLITEVCAHSVIGHGIDGYAEAVAWLLQNAGRKITK